MELSDQVFNRSQNLLAFNECFKELSDFNFIRNIYINRMCWFVYTEICKNTIGVSFSIKTNLPDFGITNGPMLSLQDNFYELYNIDRIETKCVLVYLSSFMHDYLNGVISFFPQTIANAWVGEYLHTIQKDCPIIELNQKQKDILDFYYKNKDIVVDMKIKRNYVVSNNLHEMRKNGIMLK